MEQEKVKGVVKWFDPNKGYGFITKADGKDIFVHVSELPGDIESLVENEEVEFEIGEGKKGPVATNVRLII